MVRNYGSLTRTHAAIFGRLFRLKKALAQGKAWISGLRREQSPTRQNVQFFLNHDHRFHSIKVCPLIHWTWKEVWRYVYKHDLPYNPLHDIGYPSIGCEVCTRPSEGGSSDRSGRWSGTGKNRMRASSVRSKGEKEKYGSSRILCSVIVCDEYRGEWSSCLNGGSHMLQEPLRRNG
ncbi:hypothetical protein GCM10020331_068940 [Ectobacillus funiculus]